MPRLITLTANPALDFSFEVETMEPNRKLRSTALRSDPGGGGVNVARAGMRLGMDTLAIFPAGGVYGRELVHLVEKEGVPLRAVTVSGVTRPAFHARETSTGKEYRFNFPGEPLGAEDAGLLLAALLEAVHADDYVVGSGSLPPGGPDDFWARAIRISKSRKARFVLDTTGGEAAAIREGLFLLRKNKIEIADLAGRALAFPDEAIEFARRFVEETAVERLVITHGGEGAIMASREGVFRAAGYPVDVVSAVGAGDSFTAALVYSLMKGDDDATALRFAMAAASATLLTPGTALFDPEVARRLHAGP